VNTFVPSIDYFKVFVSLLFWQVLFSLRDEDGQESLVIVISKAYSHCHLLN
jgi:hypothetical protein